MSDPREVDPVTPLDGRVVALGELVRELQSSLWRYNRAIASIREYVDLGPGTQGRDLRDWDDIEKIITEELGPPRIGVWPEDESEYPW